MKRENCSQKWVILVNRRPFGREIADSNPVRGREKPLESLFYNDFWSAIAGFANNGREWIALAFPVSNE